MERHGLTVVFVGPLGSDIAQDRFAGLLEVADLEQGKWKVLSRNLRESETICTVFHQFNYDKLYVFCDGPKELASKVVYCI
jgi:hypothetical protein